MIILSRPYERIIYCREQSSTQQLTDAASQELKPLATSMETVTIPTTFIESFSGHHTSSQAQLTEKEGLLSTILPQSMNSSFLPTSTSATSTTVSAMPHQATSHSLPLVPNFHSNHPKALPNIANLKSISADKASEAFRKHRADLLVAVTDPLILANSLYSYSIISRETLNRVKLLTLTPAEKNMEIFDAIEAQIKTNPSSFVTLLDILNDDSQLCIIAGQLQQSYREFYNYTE